MIQVDRQVSVKLTNKIVIWFAGAIMLLVLGVTASFWAYRQIENESGIQGGYAVSLFGLLFLLAFGWLIYRESQQKLRNLIHLETQHLLEIQEALNARLELANITLRDSEEKLAVTLNSIGDAVITTDAEGRVIRLNPVAEQLIGWLQAEATGRPVSEVFHILNQETRQPSKIPVMETLALGTIQGLANHTLLVARDGKECSIADSCAPIRNRDGQVIGAVLVFRNVTEEYAVQQALRDRGIELESAKSVAEKANLAKSDFLSSMSHELRTPLNAILGFAQLLETGAPPPTPAQKRNIEQILKGGWYLLELVNEILDLALIEAGRVTLSGEPVSLLEIMLECRAMIEPMAQKRGIGMTFLHFDLPYHVKADRTRLKQVMINLLVNAVKYNQSGGSVTVECAPRPPDLLRISVRDTGVGMSPEQLMQLFQPFNRMGKEATLEEGTGIGLVVTKRLIELMGGSIGADSSTGEGSVFWIELRRTAAPQLSAHKVEQGVRVRPGLPEGTPLRTLLYVEDNPANLELVEQLVARRADLRLLSAADGSLGIEFARTYLPEVILMDINLPGISGIDAMQILRLDPATAHIPIIAISANAMPRDIEKALEAGFFDYLTKPIKLGEFMDKLDEALKFSHAAAARAVHKEPAP